MDKQNQKVKNQIILYKGVIVHNIHKHLVAEGKAFMTKDLIDQEIKINAGFPYESCADPKVTIEDMSNLIAWAIVYGDAQGIHINMDDPIDDQLDLDFNRPTLEELWDRWQALVKANPRDPNLPQGVYKDETPEEKEAREAYFKASYPKGKGSYSSITSTTCFGDTMAELQKPSY